MADTQIVKDFEMNGMNVEVKVSYNLGGMNWATSREEKRGYYLHVQPYTLSVSSGATWRKTTGFSGVKYFLLEVNRKSAKKLQEAVGLVNDELIERMLTQCNFN